MITDVKRFLEGHVALSKGERATCPYVKGSKEYEAWHEGYRQAREQSSWVFTS